MSGTLNKPLFWRDARLPFVELRQLQAGQGLCYAPHSHRQWSLGAITRGRSDFCYAGQTHAIETGDLVVINPEWVHACNPLTSSAWGYWMLYVDKDWLAQLRFQLGGLDQPVWEDFSTPVFRASQHHAAMCQVAETLVDVTVAVEEKEQQLVAFLARLLPDLKPVTNPASKPQGLLAVEAYLHASASLEVSLEDLCRVSGYSEGHLIRVFRQHLGLTPHAYLINRRVERGRQALQQGQPIAEAALLAGFSDQAHFQRTFKRLWAATPNQYRQALLQD
ncbi:AraC family transcriptional regulator [Marinospirillum perlucidum]|uniref:AraC family transcriptional regulator n=1 Tax=Marinospirillum perlucidum TaxID=1982602 RepID=UPI001C498ECD|nr:AraC family transcriptional regulator [Marinospirillum perlucidum]